MTNIIGIYFSMRDIVPAKTYWNIHARSSSCSNNACLPEF